MGGPRWVAHLFLMSGGGGDRFGVGGWCVRDNLSDSGLFRCASKVYLFFCLKKSRKLLVNYKTQNKNNVKKWR